MREGEYLLAVAGKDVRPPANVYSFFENTSGKIVEITVGPNPDGSGSRTVSVVPVANEGALRNRDWVEGNLKKVNDATKGRVAYVYVPDTAGQGHEYFKRYFFPQTHKDAVIIDERFNGGGQVADYYIDLLRRPLVCVLGDALRRGPEGAGGVHSGTEGDDHRRDRRLRRRPVAVDVQEVRSRPARRSAHVGRTRRHARLPRADGRRPITAPNLAIWTADEGWTVENEGVAPDIEVEQTPADVIAGRDPQLEKAIEVALQALKQKPPSIRSGRRIR